MIVGIIDTNKGGIFYPMVRVLHGYSEMCVIMLDQACDDCCTTNRLSPKLEDGLENCQFLR
jgi:hypothetical protein